MIKKNICLIIFSFIFQFSYSQACGGGKFKFEFYTKSNDSLKYEIIEVEVKDTKLLSEDLYRGVLVDEDIMNGISLHTFDKNKLPNFISKSIGDGNGINNNEIIFNTLELYNKLYLLKVWNLECEIYILANLFGGCNRKTILVMIPENPILIK